MSVHSIPGFPAYEYDVEKSQVVSYFSGAAKTLKWSFYYPVRGGQKTIQLTNMLGKRVTLTEAEIIGLIQSFPNPYEVECPVLTVLANNPPVKSMTVKVRSWCGPALAGVHADFPYECVGQKYAVNASDHCHGLIRLEYGIYAPAQCLDIVNVEFNTDPAPAVKEFEPANYVVRAFYSDEAVNSHSRDYEDFTFSAEDAALEFVEAKTEESGAYMSYVVMAVQVIARADVEIERKVSWHCSI